MAPILSFSLALIAAISPVYSQWTVGQEVKTTSGTAKGHAASSQKDVSEYLGIRFGETTDKENRFLPPKKYTGTGPIDATKFVSCHGLSVEDRLLTIECRERKTKFLN
jgi:hypothetical protein